VPTSFQDILLSFDFVGSGIGNHQAFLCRRTGKIYWHSEFSDLDEFSDELPDDVEDDEKYIAIPDKESLVSASRWRWILRANFCLMTSNGASSIR